MLGSKTGSDFDSELSISWSNGLLIKKVSLKNNLSVQKCSKFSISCQLFDASVGCNC